MNKRDKMKLNTANKSKVSQKAATHRRTKTQNKKKYSKKRTKMFRTDFSPSFAPKRQRKIISIQNLQRVIYMERRKRSLCYCYYYDCSFADDIYIALMLSQDGDEMNNLTRNENTRKILQIDKNKSSMQKAKSDERKHNN